MSVCEEACDHLFEAATLSAQLVAAEINVEALTAERDRYRTVLEAWPCPAGCAPGNERCDWCHGTGKHPRAQAALATNPEQSR